MVKCNVLIHSYIYAHVNVNPQGSPCLDPRNTDTEHLACQNLHPILNGLCQNAHPRDICFYEF